MLLDAGADSEWNGHYGLSLIEMARERGYEDVAVLLEKTRDSRGRVAQSPTREDHEIHRAAASGDVQRVRELLEADPSLIDLGDRAGGTPLHRGVVGRSRNVVEFLLDHGAPFMRFMVWALARALGSVPRILRRLISRSGGFGRRPRPPLWRIATGVLKYWLWYRYTRKGARACDERMARLLIRRGAQYDLTIAAALGDIAQVRSMLDTDPSRSNLIAHCPLF